MKADLYKTNGSSPPCIPTVHATAQTAATLPNPRNTVAVALEDPTIKEAIQRGARKTKIKKYSVVTKQNGPDGVFEHISDVVQATYLALLENHTEEYTALTPEERPRFVEQLAMCTAWHEVYPMKREVPLAEPIDSDQVGSEGPHAFACDDISLNGRRRRPCWISARAFESDLIERIDRQRADTSPEETPETKYERVCRLLGARTADWMLDYEYHRYESAKTSAERVRYCRLRKRLDRTAARTLRRFVTANRGTNANVTRITKTLSFEGGENMNDEQATTNATAKERRDELKSQIDEPFFSPRIKFDRLDSFYPSGTVPSQHTSGTIVLDALEVNWHIDEDTSRWKASTGERNRFDLRIEDGSDGTSFRSRPDAEEIYEAVVRALRNRHHSELCECPDCQIRQDM